MTHTNRENKPQQKPNAIFLPSNCTTALQTKNGGIMTRYLTIGDVAHYLNFSSKYVYRCWRKWAAEGLRVYKIGGSPRFRQNEIDDWISKKNRLVSA